MGFKMRKMNKGGRSKIPTSVKVKIYGYFHSARLSVKDQNAGR